jgi:hypothetical protein
MALKNKIKCPICNKWAKLTKTNLSLFEGKLKVKDTPIYECKKCKEQFGEGESIDAVQKMVEKEYFNFQRQIISTGGSLGITFPGDLSSYCKLKKGSVVNIFPLSKNEIRIITKGTN